MSKFIKSIKNKIYINLSNYRRLVATAALAGSLSSFMATAGTPVTLADENSFDSNRAFLTVQPITIDEKDNDSLLWQNNIFVTVNKTWLAVPAIKTIVQTK
ncbi:hypothetical protein KJ590_03740, partial [Patescibacteria group bacterium]|nr:hypothetical protein [Patescibacteria group bacterium]